MRIAPSAAAPAAADPIAWINFEQRGTLGSEAGGRYSVSTLDLEPWVRSLARLEDGRLSYPGDGGTLMFWYESSEHLLRDGVDPVAALQQAQAGVAALTGAVDRAQVDLESFRVTQNVKHPREADTVEVWMRRESGAAGRYIIPLAQAPSSVRDAMRAADELSRTIRRNYDRLDPA